MKWFLMIGVAFFLSCSSIKQISNHPNDFRKYSYLLIITKKNKPPQENYALTGLATGFFISKGGKTYLVSANHVFTGNNPFLVTRNDSTAPDLIAVRFDNSEHDRSLFTNIYTDSIKKINPPKRFDQYPDLLVYEIELPKKAKVQTVNRFIKTDYRPWIEDSVFFWGYPTSSEQYLSNLLRYDNNKNHVRYTGNFIDQDSLYFVTSPACEKGFSGSPVFAKTKKGEYIFTGIVSSANKAWNVSHIVKYTELLKLMEGL